MINSWTAQIQLGLLWVFFLSFSDHGLARLVEAYRAHGHKAAKINPLLPLEPVADSVPEISLLADTVRGTLNTSGDLQTEEPACSTHPVYTCMDLFLGAGAQVWEKERVCAFWKIIEAENVKFQAWKSKSW